ncbi:MAG: CAP domain-containing protein [Eubacteriales bacterium]|nr:CAP domain-containing protein [Eubacteriales bacterium]
MISKTQSRMRTVIGITVFALLACIIMPLSMETGSVSAATKKPSKVTLTSVSSAGSTSISIKWKKAKNAKKYQVYRATSKNGKYERVVTTKSRSYVNKKLKTGKKYYFKVRALNGKKKGAFSKKVSAVPKAKKAAGLKDIQNQMLQKVNKERKAAGVKPLALYEPINKTSQEKAVDLYKTGVFEHYSKNLGWCYDQFDRAGITYMAAAENIAWGQGSVSSAMNSWMHSSGHKRNILDKDMTHLGVGYYKGYWVQQFIQIPEE